MKLFTKPQPTGASPLHLNNKELRRELAYADTIIANIESIIIDEQKGCLEAMNAINANATSSDPFRSESRKRVMHRITPKRDYLKIILIALCILLGFAWYTAQLDRDLLMQQTTQTAGVYPNGSIH